MQEEPENETHTNFKDENENCFETRSRRKKRAYNNQESNSNDKKMRKTGKSVKILSLINIFQNISINFLNFIDSLSLNIFFIYDS